MMTNDLVSLKGFKGRLAHVPVHVQRYGWWGASRLYLDRMHELFTEWRLGIATKAYANREELGFPEEYSEYIPVNYRCLDAILRYLAPGPDDVAIDYGSGMGRALVAFGRYPLKRVIGVELSGALCETARVNVERAKKHLKCKEVEIVAQDALEYEVPDDVSIIFFFNPFNGAAFNAVLERVLASLARAPRPLRIVHMRDQHCSRALDQCDWLRKVDEFAVPQCQYQLEGRDMKFHVYVNPEQPSQKNVIH